MMPIEWTHCQEGKGHKDCSDVSQYRGHTGRLEVPMLFDLLIVRLAAGGVVQIRTSVETSMMPVLSDESRASLK